MIDDDLDEIPIDIMRLAQDVSHAWRRCHRKICKRGRGCRGRDMPCLAECPPRRTPRNPEKAARDDARAMAIFQRRLRERVAADEREAATDTMSPPAKRRRPD